MAPPRAPQFYWLWSPLNFPDRFMLYHNNADGDGTPWNTASVIGESGRRSRRSTWRVAARRSTTSPARATPRRCIIETRDTKGGEWRAELTPKYNFYMSGIGYGHPEWGHGRYKGENELMYDRFKTAEVNENLPHFQHIQAFVHGDADGTGREDERRGHSRAARASARSSRTASRASSIPRHERTRGQTRRLSARQARRARSRRSRISRAFRAARRARPIAFARATRGRRAVDRGLILRRDPTASLIETERTTEYRAYEAFHKLGLPVPEPIALELGSAALERPFFIMAEVENCATGSIMSPDPYGAHREKVGEQFYHRAWARSRPPIRTRSASATSRARRMSATRRCTKSRAGKKSSTRTSASRSRSCAPRIRWLKRNPPPPAQKISVVHGDYRTGNFLVDDDGDIRAILDWEMSHLGDPLEDLGWAIDPLWAGADPARPGGMIPRADAIRIWEKASGLKADPKALHWWEIFASLKGAAIWISAALRICRRTQHRSDQRLLRLVLPGVPQQGAGRPSGCGARRMKPEVGTILGLTAQKIAMGLGEQGAAFAQGTVGLIAMRARRCRRRNMSAAPTSASPRTARFARCSPNWRLR